MSLQCRQKKMNREDELRGELDTLHARHAELFKTFQALNAELVEAKCDAMRHQKAGCSMPAPALTPQDMEA